MATRHNSTCQCVEKKNEDLDFRANTSKNGLGNPGWLK